MKSTKDFGKLLSEKKGFITSVYLSLALQLCITAFVATYLRQHPSTYEQIHKWFWLWFVLALLILVVMGLVPMPLPVKFMVLCIFSIVIGLNCIAASKRISVNSIKIALVATIALFIIMSLVGFSLVSMGIHLGFMAYTLVCCLLALLVAFIVMLFVQVPTWLHKAILVIGITLFSAFISYDTNIMLQRDYDGDVVTATVDLYLDMLNMFTEFVAYNQK